MIFVNVAFPDCIAFNARFEPEWQTTLTTAIGGEAFANIDWEDELLTADVSLTARPVSEYVELRAHFAQMRGRGKSFPFKDYLGFEAAASDGVLVNPTTGAAPAADGTFQLAIRYGTGSDAYDKKVTRPDSPIQVFRTRSAVTTDITGAGAAVTYTTGAVAITGHSSGDTYHWTGTYKVPCRYDIDRLPAVIINKQGGDSGELLVSCGPITIVQVRE